LILYALRYGNDVLLGEGYADGLLSFDNSAEFLSNLNGLLGKHFSPFDKPHVEAPFLKLGWTKKDSFKYGMEQHGEEFASKFTMTCWTTENDLECGKCKHCLSKAALIAEWNAHKNYEGI
jgi:7-cyano-7-deazaguanine synthase in queuosine biosynthesis